MEAGYASLWGGLIEGLQGRRDNQHNRREAQRQRGWQERMLRTEYQIKVDDLRAAGLNPMLAYMNAPGGVPSGGVGYAASGGSIVGSATQAAKLATEIEKLEAEITALGAQYGLNSQQQINLNQAINTEIQKTELLKQQGLFTASEAKLNEMTVNVIKNLESSMGEVTEDPGFAKTISEILKIWILKK